MKKIILGLLFVLLIAGCVTIDKGNFGPFKRSLNDKSYGYKISPDITKTAPTKMIEIFEVKPGDCSSNNGWSDCANDRERSELSGSKDNYPGSEYWYGWSIYFPKEYKNIYPTKTALGQFHQKHSHPVWMFQNSSGGYYLDQQVHGHTEMYYPLISKKDLREKWHKIEIHAKWATNNNGFFKVWVNGVQKVNYIGQTMTAAQVYFKYGIYRSFLSRYKNAHKVNKVPSQTVFYSNIKRADTRKYLSATK
ncbi:MAG: polysaccharide lyase [Campylobacteraceae bacterium]|nr:polysaccharide lyase [Campylobacteraceae bacterium]